MDDLNGVLGQTLSSNQYGGIGSKYFGGAQMAGGDYTIGGQSYHVTDNGNNTRTVSRGGGNTGGNNGWGSWNGSGFTPPSSNGNGNNDGYPTLNDLGGSALDFSRYLNGRDDAAFGDYFNAAKSMPLPMDIYNAFASRMGLPQQYTTASNLREAVGNLEDSIRKVEPTVNSTTTNSLVTEGQRQKMVTDQRYPLEQVLAPTSTALGRVQQGIDATNSQVGTLTGLQLQGQQQQLDPYKMRMTQVAEQNSRMMTGFTSDRETTLNLLMDKLHRNQYLSDREWQQAADLKKMQQTFQNTKDQYMFELQNPKGNYSFSPPGLYSNGYTFNQNTGQWTPVDGGGGGSGFDPFGNSGQWFSGGNGGGQWTLQP